MEKRFTALATIAFVLKALGVLVFIAAIILAVLAVINGTNIGVWRDGWQTLPTIASVIGILVSGAISAIMLYAYGELIDLLISLEFNTRQQAHYARASAEMLRELGKRLVRQQGGD
jgi:uncharacterized integral membrane protein